MLALWFIQGCLKALLLVGVTQLKKPVMGARIMGTSTSLQLKGCSVQCKGRLLMHRPKGNGDRHKIRYALSAETNSSASTVGGVRGDGYSMQGRKQGTYHRNEEESFGQEACIVAFKSRQQDSIQGTAARKYYIGPGTFGARRCILNAVPLSNQRCAIHPPRPPPAL